MRFIFFCRGNLWVITVKNCRYHLKSCRTVLALADIFKASFATSICLGRYVRIFAQSAIMLRLKSGLDYLPTYFQACRFASPVGSGVDLLGLGCTIMPFGLVAGISVAKSGKYRPQLWLAWVSLIVSGGLLLTLKADSSRSKYIGYQVFIGLGLGILMTTAFFPVLAPLPVSLNANALAFFMFVRFFSQVYLIPF